MIKMTHMQNGTTQVTHVSSYKQQQQYRLAVSWSNTALSSTYAVFLCHSTYFSSLVTSSSLRYLLF